MEPGEVPAHMRTRNSAAEERKQALGVRREQLLRRLDEIRVRRRRLAAGESLDEDDRLAAEDRAWIAAERSVEAHRAAADALDQAATMHRRRADQHGPDEAAERDSAEADSASAERHRRLAADEQRFLDETRPS